MHWHKPAAPGLANGYRPGRQLPDVMATHPVPSPIRWWRLIMAPGDGNCEGLSVSVRPISLQDCRRSPE